MSSLWTSIKNVVQTKDDAMTFLKNDSSYYHLFKRRDLRPTCDEFKLPDHMLSCLPCNTWNPYTNKNGDMECTGMAGEKIIFSYKNEQRKNRCSNSRNA